MVVFPSHSLHDPGMDIVVPPVTIQYMSGPSCPPCRTIIQELIYIDEQHKLDEVLNKMPQQRLEPQTVQLMGNDSTTELSCHP